MAWFSIGERGTREGMPRRRRAWAAAAGIALGGCLDGADIAGPLDGGLCVNAAECDDGNPCTADACGDAYACTHTAVADGPLPAADQTLGDCKQITCSGGEPETVADPTDMPEGSGPCNVGTCLAHGVPALEDAPDGTACGAGLVCARGICD